MTPQMISKARLNVDKGGQSNIEFRLGEIEHLPVEDGIVDVIMSNCVINLSPNKAAVFKEAYRVLKPGGRVAISDVVSTQALPHALKRDMDLYSSCLSGAATIQDIESMLNDAGFEQILIKPKESSKAFIQDWAPGSRLEDYVVSSTIEAVKPN